MKNNSTPFLSVPNTKRTPFPRFRTLLLITISPLFFGTCGITDALLLSPATITHLTQEAFRIDHNSLNSSKSFRGYKVYYKIYRKSLDITKITEDYNYITDATKAPSESRLTSRNYFPIKLFNWNGSSFEEIQVKDAHFSNITRDENSSVYIDLSTGTARYSPVRTTDGEGVEDGYFTTGNNNDEFHALFIDHDRSVKYIKRNTTPPRGFFNNKAGSKAFSANDKDISKMLGSTFSYANPLVVRFAVIPYGIDFSLGGVAFGNIVLSNEIEILYNKTPS